MPQAITPFHPPHGLIGKLDIRPCAPVSTVSTLRFFDAPEPKDENAPIG